MLKTNQYNLYMHCFRYCMLFFPLIPLSILRLMEGECFAGQTLPTRVNHKLFQTSLIIQYINLF